MGIYSGRMWPHRIEQPRWMLTLRVGAVITNGGAWRVVGDLSRYRDGRLHTVSLVIRRCSWTGRCYTVLNATDLRLMGYRRVNVRPLKLKGKIDKRIHMAIHEKADQKSMTCCDVVGIIP